MALRPCLGTPGQPCGKLTAYTRCGDCKRKRERGRQRPTTGDRGYGIGHQALREALRPEVEAGNTACWRCGERIPPDTPWHLGHDDHDRTQYRGPEHVTCNLRAAGGQRAKA